MNISHVFDVKFNGQHNFMTPTVIRYGTAGGMLYELSRGEGFDHDTIYGLTFLTPDGERPENDPSGCLHSMQDVEDILEGLGEDR